MSDGTHHEIIIIKRHGDHEEGHHGGAWKIALADFMTAMMALFLVMWLINSTSKAQKQSIAEYFNPVKLAEVTHDRKGLADPQNAPSETGGGPAEGQESGAGADKDAGKGAGKGAAAAPGSRARESALFQDPYAVLARLAAEAERSDVASADAAATETGAPGISGGDAARDPFDPLYWQVENLPRHRTEQPGPPNTVASVPRETRPDVRGQAVQTARLRDPSGAKPASPVMRVASADATLPLPREAAAEAGAPAKDAKVPDAKSSDAKVTETKAAETKAPEKAPDFRAVDARAAEIKAEIAKLVQPTAAPAPHVEVRRTGEGVLISITDDLNFSMFPVGSAEPSPKVVKALERIARIIAARPGKVVVRGHTDGRPFRSETYDNWRLSASRAQIASYMLVRGGFDERRLERIEGYADRQPRLPADPKAAENRRIEILLLGQPE